MALWRNEHWQSRTEACLCDCLPIVPSTWNAQTWKPTDATTAASQPRFRHVACEVHCMKCTSSVRRVAGDMCGSTKGNYVVSVLKTTSVFL